MQARFSSFDEIDNRLKMLAIQRQISVERFRLYLRETRNDLVREGLIQSIKPALTSLAISWGLKKVRERIARYREAHY